MSTTVRVPIAQSEYTLVTNKVALIQVNQASIMEIGDVITPDAIAANGFYMEKHEKFVNNSLTAYIWIRPIDNVTNPSVTLSEV